MIVEGQRMVSDGEGEAGSGLEGPVAVWGLKYKGADDVAGLTAEMERYGADWKMEERHLTAEMVQGRRAGGWSDVEAVVRIF